MKFFRCRFGVVQRSRGGSVIGRAAYQACAKLRTPEGRVIDRSNDHAAHGHVQTIMIAPTGSPAWATDVQMCWSKAAQAERRVDAQEARTIEISLPRGLPPELMEKCVRALVARFVAAGMVVQADIHVSRAADGGLNPHVHLILSLRRIDGDTFARNKAREWNRIFYADPRKLRGEIAATLNEFCAQHGVAYQADARSNKARGLALPEPTIPRWNILQAKRTGRRSAWLQECDEVRQTKIRLTAFEVELAAVDQAIRIKHMVERLREVDPASPFVAFIDAKPVAARAAVNPDRGVSNLGRRIAAKSHPTPSIVPTEADAVAPSYELEETGLAFGP